MAVDRPVDVKFWVFYVGEVNWNKRVKLIYIYNLGFAKWVKQMLCIYQTGMIKLAVWGYLYVLSHVMYMSFILKFIIV